MENIIATVNSGEVARETITDVSPSHSYEEIGNIAVISVDGAMTKKNNWMNTMCGGFVSYDIITEYINRAENSAKIDTVLFNVDTAGGEVAGADETGERIFSSSKKTVTFYNNLGASAGIWVFSASKERYANRTALIGSIGVMAGYRDSKSDDSSVTLVSKNAQNKSCAINGDCKQKIQARIDDVEKIFYERVTRNTGLSAGEISSKFGYGDVVSAQDAKEIGFLKEVTTLNDLIKSLQTTVTVPTVSDDKPVNLNQGADMKFDRENLDEAEATFNILVANRDTLTARIERIEMQLQTATTALEARTEEANTLSARLSEAESTVRAEFGTRLNEAASLGVNMATAVAMVNASSPEEASILAIKAKESNGATVQTNADADKTKAKQEHEFALAVAKRLSV
jgi:ClpP class serine protease